jgi:hypothetical protein
MAQISSQMVSELCGLQAPASNNSYSDVVEVTNFKYNQSLQDGAHGSQPVASRPLAGRRSKKVAYCVFYGRSTGVFTEWFVNLSFLCISF